MLVSEFWRKKRLEKGRGAEAIASKWWLTATVGAAAEMAESARGLTKACILKMDIVFRIVRKERFVRCGAFSVMWWRRMIFYFVALICCCTYMYIEVCCVCSAKPSGWADKDREKWKAFWEGQVAVSRAAAGAQSKISNPFVDHLHVLFPSIYFFLLLFTSKNPSCLVDRKLCPVSDQSLISRDQIPTRFFFLFVIFSSTFFAFCFFFPTSISTALTFSILHPILITNIDNSLLWTHREAPLRILFPNRKTLSQFFFFCVLAQFITTLQWRSYQLYPPQ